MLCLSRLEGQSVYITGGNDTIVVKVLEFRDGRVRLGFSAPKHIQIMRDDVKARMANGEPLHAIESDLDMEELASRIVREVPKQSLPEERR